MSQYKVITTVFLSALLCAGCASCVTPADGVSLGPLTLISLGLLPNKQAHVTATVAGVLIDVRTGYVDGENESYSTFVQDFEDPWTGVLNVHATSAPTQAPDASGWYYSRN